MSGNKAMAVYGVVYKHTLPSGTTVKYWSIFNDSVSINTAERVYGNIRFNDTSYYIRLWSASVDCMLDFMNMIKDAKYTAIDFDENSALKELIMQALYKAEPSKSTTENNEVYNA